MAGKKGRSGRHKAPRKQIEEYLAENEERIPEILDALFNMASVQINTDCPYCGGEFSIPGAGDREAAKYVLDRYYGRPRQAQEIQVRRQTNVNLTLELKEIANQILSKHLKAEAIDGETVELDGSMISRIAESDVENHSSE